MLKGARMMGASQEMVISNWDKHTVVSRANVPANLDMVAAELKKINYNLSKIIDLKKQDNYIVAAFCACMFVMCSIFLVMSFVGGHGKLLCIREPFVSSFCMFKDKIFI
jgi:hypothetical protein